MTVKVIRHPPESVVCGICHGIKPAFLPKIPEGGKMSGKKNNGYKGKACKETRRTRTEANTHYKDTVFRMLFRDKGRLLGLYNAVSGKRYTDPDDLEIITLEGAVYMGMRNDLAFVIDFGLHLYEHQSTINNNMPLRFLLYVSAEYGKLVERKKLFEEKLAKIDTPHFMVFYNGTKACPERQELKLSDAFHVREDDPELELRVQVLNINEGYNEGLKEQCRTLKEYMQYVDKVRGYVKEMPVSEAVDRAVDECIEQDILKEFLLKEKAEVKRMSLLECDAELALEIAKESGEEKGMAKMLIEKTDAAMRNFHISLQEACQGLGHTLEEYEKAKEFLKNKEQSEEEVKSRHEIAL